MKEFSVFIMAFSLILSAADVIGDKRIIELESRLRSFFADSTKRSTQNVVHVFKKSNELPFKPNEKSPAIVLFWLSASVAIIALVILLAWVFVPGVRINIETHLNNLLLVGLGLLLSGLIVFILTSLFEAFALIILGMFIGLFLFSLMVFTGIIIFIAKTYLYIDNFSKKYNLRSTLYVSGIILGLVGIFIDYLIN